MSIETRIGFYGMLRKNGNSRARALAKTALCRWRMAITEPQGWFAGPDIARPGGRPPLPRFGELTFFAIAGGLARARARLRRWRMEMERQQIARRASR